MANNIVFNKGQGGLGRPLPGTDYISGLLFYSGATLPTGFSSNDRIKVVYSVDDAVDLGITNTSLGETKSTATYLVTTKFTAGDTFKLTVATIASTSPIAVDAAAGTRTLCDFTALTADAVSTTTSATAIAAAINLGTATHGFTATSNTATVTITAEAGQGVFLNSGTPYVVTTTGAVAGTLTQNVVAGIASDIDILYYHISEYFRIQPKGKLYVGIYALADATTFASITLMQNYAQGEIKQLGIFQKNTAFATSQCTTIQTVLTALEGNHKPLVAIYNAEISATSDVSTLTNLRTLTAPEVSVCIGQDGAGKGFKLWKATAKSIGCLGTTLGAVSFAKVSEDIAWVGKFNMANTEFEILSFSNGELFTAVTDGNVNNIDLYGYIFLKKHIGISGSYFDDSHSCVSLTSDYAYIENNRTILKSIRSMRALLLPQLASPIKVNDDGTLAEDTISFYKTLCSRALDVMVRDGELSAFNVIIDPSQDVLSTSQLVITVELVLLGVARTITVNVGFVTAIS
jgi:hypothetical protein